MQARFLCNSITERNMAIVGDPNVPRTVYDAVMFPVITDASDKQIWAANPGGQVHFSGLRHKWFSPGKFYVVEITEDTSRELV